jgi:hypothetical protein
LKANRADFLELSQEVLNRGALLRFQANGGSMHPFIKSGNILVVEPLKGISVNIGDVVFYHCSDRSLIAHRLVKINVQKGETLLVTRGDSLNYFDPPVQPAQVMGRIVEIENGRKHLRLSKWSGRIFGFLVALSERGRYPQQTRITRNLGRIWWLTRGKRIK